MKKLSFPACEESVVQEILTRLNRSNAGEIHGVPNTVSFERNGWLSTDYLQEHHCELLERGYYLFDGGSFASPKQSPRLGLVRTSNIVDIIVLMRCGGKETPTDQVAEFFRRLQSKRCVFARHIAQDAVLGWVDPCIENPKDHAEEIVKICPSITKCPFRGKKGLIGSIEKNPKLLELEWR